MGGRIFGHTVWARGSVDDMPRNIRPLVWVALPVLDVALIVFGIVAVTVGSPTVDAVTVLIAAKLWAAVLVIAALAALIGLAFRLAWCEMYAKLLLSGALLTYALWACVSPVATGHLSALLAACLALGVTAVLGWRIYYLSGKIGRRSKPA